MIKETVLIALAFLSLCLIAPISQAQEFADLPTAKRLGIVGEQYNGLIGAVKTPVSPELHSYITRINTGRMTDYQNLSRRTGQPLAAVQAHAGQNFILVTPPGQFYKNANGHWVRQE